MTSNRTCCGSSRRRGRNNSRSFPNGMATSPAPPTGPRVWFARRNEPDLKKSFGLASDADADQLRKNLESLDKRIDVARTIALGTNVADSVTAAVNREASNMVQGIIVFSDGRSNLGSESSYLELRERAAREKIPIFTIAVGEDRQAASITITDVQAPDSAHRRGMEDHRRVGRREHGKQGSGGLPRPVHARPRYEDRAGGPHHERETDLRARRSAARSGGVRHRSRQAARETHGGVEGRRDQEAGIAGGEVVRPRADRQGCAGSLPRPRTRPRPAGHQCRTAETSHLAGHRRAWPRVHLPPHDARARGAGSARLADHVRPERSRPHRAHHSGKGRTGHPALPRPAGSHQQDDFPRPEAVQPQRIRPRHRLRPGLVGTVAIPGGRSGPLGSRGRRRVDLHRRADQHVPTGPRGSEQRSALAAVECPPRSPRRYRGPDDQADSEGAAAAETLPGTDCRFGTSQTRRQGHQRPRRGVGTVLHRSREVRPRGGPEERVCSRTGGSIPRIR